MLRGHAIECRINAEDPSRGFLPSPGRITRYREPSGPGCASTRACSRARRSAAVRPDDREADRARHGPRDARRRMLRALDEFEIGGVQSLLGFHRALLAHPCFIAGETCHGVVESEELAQQARGSSRDDGSRRGGRSLSTQRRASGSCAELDGRRVEVRLLEPEPPYRELARRRRERAAGGAGSGGADSSSAPCREPCSPCRSPTDDGRSGQVICIDRGDEDGERGDAHRPAVAELSVAPGAADDRPGDLRDPHRLSATFRAVERKARIWFVLSPRVHRWSPDAPGTPPMNVRARSGSRCNQEHEFRLPDERVTRSACGSPRCAVPRTAEPGSGVFRSLSANS